MQDILQTTRRDFLGMDKFSKHLKRKIGRDFAEKNWRFWKQKEERWRGKEDCAAQRRRRLMMRIECPLFAVGHGSLIHQSWEKFLCETVLLSVKWFISLIGWGKSRRSWIDSRRRTLMLQFLSGWIYLGKLCTRARHGLADWCRTLIFRLLFQTSEWSFYCTISGKSTWIDEFSMLQAFLWLRYIQPRSSDTSRSWGRPLRVMKPTIRTRCLQKNKTKIFSSVLTRGEATSLSACIRCHRCNLWVQLELI